MKVPRQILLVDEFHFQLSNVNKDSNQNHMQKDVSSYYPLLRCPSDARKRDGVQPSVWAVGAVRKSQADKESYNKQVGNT